MVRHGVEQGVALTRSVLAVVAAAAAFYAVTAPYRAVERGGVRWFVHLGETYLNAADTSAKLGPQLGAQSRDGYDGQYYFGVAVDPANARDYMDGKAGYVYGRVLLPLVAGALGGGSVRFVPWTMLGIGLASVLGATYAVAAWLRRRGLSPWPAALLGLYPGLVFAVFRDLTEPLAYALAALGLLALDRRRTWTAAALLALSLLTREAAAPFALAAVALVAVDRRTWRPPLAFAAATLLPVTGWRIFVALWTGQETGQSTSPVPFEGFMSWPFDQQHRLILAVVIVPALLAAVGAVVVLRETPVFASLLLVNVLVYVVFLARPNDVDWGSAGRDAVPCVLATLYCLGPGVKRAPLWAALALWSMPVFLAVAWRLDLSGFDLMTL